MYSLMQHFIHYLTRKFEGDKITTRTSREATNRWEHDLNDASKKYQDDFSGHSKQLVHRYFNPLKNYHQIFFFFFSKFKC